MTRARTFKRTVRAALDHGARWSGVLSFLERRREHDLTVLMYHRVLSRARCDAYPFPTLAMPEDDFDAQVRWLAARCDVRPLREHALGTSTSAGRPRVAITFDDGYEDNLRVAAPILERHGVRATFFVTTDFVARGRLLWFDRAAQLLARADTATIASCTPLAAHADAHESTATRVEVGAWMERLKRARPAARARFLDELEHALRFEAPLAGYEPLTVADVGELARRGHEVGSHSVTHPLLPQLDDAELARELGEARTTLAAWTNDAIEGFCYPNGDHDERVVAATRAAGYGYACSTMFGRNARDADRLRLARVDVSPQRVAGADGRFDTTSFRAELCAWHEVWR